MTDPLGLIGSCCRPDSVRPEGARLPGGGTPVDPNQPTFKDVLLKNIEEVNRLQQDANSAITDLATGQRTDVEGVLMATQKADTAFRMLLQVRNRVMDAYDEMKQIRV